MIMRVSFRFMVITTYPEVRDDDYYEGYGCEEIRVMTRSTNRSKRAKRK
jgi:hypothetical protein